MWERPESKNYNRAQQGGVPYGAEYSNKINRGVEGRNSTRERWTKMEGMECNAWKCGRVLAEHKLEESYADIPYPSLWGKPQGYVACDNEISLRILFSKVQ